MNKYLKFFLMIATSTLLMFFMMYFNLFSFSHFFFSQTRLFMAVMMELPWRSSCLSLCGKCTLTKSQFRYFMWQYPAFCRFSFYGSQPNRRG